MPEEIKSHQIYKQIASCTSVLNYGSTTDATYGDGWDVIWNTFPYLVNRQYIDLAGWTRQDLTTFIQGVDFQHSRRPRSTSTGILEVTTLDILSTRRLTDDEINNWGAVLVPSAQDVPGFLDSTVDLMHVVYGERVTYVSNSTMAVGLVGAVYVTLGADTFGSGNPIATDKLHWTRVAWANGSGDGEVLTLGATNLISQVTTAKEKDLVYLERLRRSYILQDQADV